MKPSLLGFSTELSQGMPAQKWALCERHQRADPGPIYSHTAWSAWAARRAAGSVLHRPAGHRPWEPSPCCQTRQRKLKKWDYVVLHTTKCRLQVIEVEKLLGFPEERNVAFFHPSDWKCSQEENKEKVPCSLSSNSEKKNIWGEKRTFSDSHHSRDLNDVSLWYSMKQTRNCSSIVGLFCSCL